LEGGYPRMRTAVRLVIIPLTVVRLPRGRKPKSKTAGSIAAWWWISTQLAAAGKATGRKPGKLERGLGAGNPRQS
jgi:hypothetical protein